MKIAPCGCKIEPHHTCKHGYTVWSPWGASLCATNPILTIKVKP